MPRNRSIRMSKTTSYRSNRSGTTQAAQHRNAGYMKHRYEPRGGSRDLQAEYLAAADEWDTSMSDDYSHYDEV